LFFFFPIQDCSPFTAVRDIDALLMEALHNHEGLDALPLFNAREWIGVGKKYVQSKIPLQVHFQMQQQQLIILHAHQARFPAIDLSVLKFIELQLADGED
jgi:hypothetical protein